jgi:2-polyprenyl-6-methoxyphenol hydroxylase-like FAD-dependent oxidoreductase
MTAPALSHAPDPITAGGRVHVIGAGPVGLLLTALLQEVEGLSVSLYEKRTEYTRKRMVTLAPYLLAETTEAYRTDAIDGDGIAALFEPEEIAEGIAYRQSISPYLMGLLRGWSLGFCPLNAIEYSLSELIDGRAGTPVQRSTATVTADDALAMLEPGSLVIDCTGSNSLLRDRLATPDASEPGANTLKVRLEYALVITFLYGQPYDCNEYCKYYKNIENAQYKFIPMVNRTHYDGNVSHVTGIVNITQEEYEAMPGRFDGEWLRANFPGVAQSMDRFVDKVRQESNGEIIGDFEVVRIPLDLYRARHATNREWLAMGPADHPLSHSPVFLAGDSAIGSPYFQSISLGFECAAYLAGLLTQPDLTLREKIDRYEFFVYKQWLRVYMRSKMIKHNKDLFESIDDPMALLEKLHIY